jgi:hypothetical protein
MLSRKSISMLAAAVAFAIGASSTLAVVPDTFARFFLDPSGASIGGFAISNDGNTIYKANFSSNQGFSQWNLVSGTWTSSPNNPFVGPTDMTAWEQSQSLAGDGETDGPTLAGGGLAILGDLILNPAPLTLTRQTMVDGVLTPTTITYPAGTLAFVMDSPTNVTSNAVAQYNLTKIGYFYDLRPVNNPNLQSNPANTGVDRNGDGIIQWNDVFEPDISRADERSVANYIGTSTGTVAHKPVFSTDGQSIYFDDQSAPTVTGGLWKIDLTKTGSAALTRILTSTSGFNTEPSVVSSSVRNFGGGTGDQIVVGGSDYSVNPNLGGVSYVVDNGTTVSTPKTLLTAKQIQAFLETSTTPNAASTASDSADNIYISDSANGGVYRYDAQGRLSKVFSKAEQYAFDTSSAATGGGGATSVVSTVIKMTVRDGATTAGAQSVSELMYPDSTSTVKAPVGVYLYTPGDFNRDGVVNAADIALFQPQIGLRGAVTASVATSSPFTQTNAAAMIFNLNGSTTVGSTQVVSVDWKDVKIFQQFAGLSDGDVNMDYAVNSTDLNILAANYGQTGKLFTQGNLTSVRIDAVDKDDVNFADLVTLAANWTAAKPPLSTLSNIPAPDLDRAFAITSGGTLSQYSAAGSGNWSTASNWTSGVPNSPGAVASLLTKPQNDTTITVDGTYTLGQLNFDNYFTYTLTGGTLQFQGANGTSAELNTFAASPTITSAVNVLSDTTATVTYSTDALTLAGPMSIDGSHVLTKAGPGTLRITNGGISTGSIALNAGTLEIAANTTLGALTGNGTGTLNLTGVATTLKVAAHSAGASAANVDLAALSLAAGTTLDLTNNRLTVETSNSSLDSTLANAISASYNSGHWNSPGITSSLAAQNPDNATAIGYLINPNSFIALYTYYGDANLDGKISADDYALLDRGFAKHLTGWSNGDFDYSGTIDSSDYMLIDRVFALTNGGSLTPTFLAQREAEFGEQYVSELITSIPEPSISVGLISLIAFNTFSRKRTGSTVLL